ncbi:unnamed protein product [Brachionus calyciflorus]|uniref:Uncharacterized protein n=1 Tax=Brachionus calyciflorus TaxID=104777 RepID=A0A814KZ76_9BILA|nr:unnamed protein product [Brachionus calyciflorus]
MERFLLIINLFQFAIGLTQLKGEFKECIVGTKLNMLEFDNDCFQDPEESLNDFEKYFDKNESIFPAFVFSKHNFILESKGFECKMLIHKFRFSKDLFLNKYVQKDIVKVTLSKSDCFTMAKENECGQFSDKKKMICNKNNECNYNDKVIEEYPFYFGTIEKNFFECHVSERIVLGRNLKSSIFHNAKSPCYPEDEVCFFEDSTVIWDKKDVLLCRFERILHVPQLQVLKNSKFSIFYSPDQEYLFKLKKLESQCGFNFFLTTEGLYLAFYNKDIHLRNGLQSMRRSRFNFNHFTDKDRNDLIFAENDYKKLKIHKSIMNLGCCLLLNTIQANINNQDLFLKLNYLATKNIFVYINSGKAFVRNCLNVSVIYKPESINKENFDRDIEILYKKNSSSNFLKGFIRSNVISRKYSIIKRKGFQIDVIDFNAKITDLNIGSANLVNLYDHHEYLVNAPDFYEKINEYLDPKETPSSFSDFETQTKLEENNKIFSSQPFGFFGEKIENFLEKIRNVYLYLIYAFLALLVFVLISFIVKKRGFFLNIFKNSKHNANKVLANELEMDEIKQKILFLD